MPTASGVIRWIHGVQTAILCRKGIVGPQHLELAFSGTLVIMPPQQEASHIPDDQISIEKRSDGTIVVRVRSAGPEESRLPDAVFSFRNGDPQYAYWLSRLAATNRPT